MTLRTELFAEVEIEVAYEPPSGDGWNTPYEDGYQYISKVTWFGVNITDCITQDNLEMLLEMYNNPPKNKRKYL